METKKYLKIAYTVGVVGAALLFGTEKNDQKLLDILQTPPQPNCEKVTTDSLIIPSRGRVKLSATFTPPEAQIKWIIGSYSEKLSNGGTIDRFENPEAFYLAPQNNSSTLEQVTIQSTLSLKEQSVRCEDLKLAIEQLARPKILSVEPPIARPGELVTIKGTNFLPYDVEPESLQVILAHEDGGVAVLASVTGYDNDPKVAKPSWTNDEITFIEGQNLPQSGSLKVIVGNRFDSWAEIWSQK